MWKSKQKHDEALAKLGDFVADAAIDISADMEMEEAADKDKLE